MSKQAFIVLNADRTEVGEPHLQAGALQQETRLYEGDRCVCVLLVTFPQGSPEWERYAAKGRAVDGTPAPVRPGTIQSDAEQWPL